MVRGLLFAVVVSFVSGAQAADEIGDLLRSMEDGGAEASTVQAVPDREHIGDETRSTTLQVPMPTPKPPLPPEGGDVSAAPTGPVPLPPSRPRFENETGLPQFDVARSQMAPLNLLPYWYKYPWAKTPNADKWTLETVKILQSHGKDLLEKVPSDAKLYCPNYANLTREERVMFWTRLISLLVERECSYNSSLTFKDVQVGPNVLSTGMLMLSLESAKLEVFGCTMIKTQDDLLDWRKNLACGIRIMNYYYERDGVIATNTGDKSAGEWRGLSRYWGPFRDKRLRTSAGRTELAKVIRSKREMWRSEGDRKSHPAYRDDEYRKAKESNLVRFYRLMNQMPFCAVD